jgi:hypothetical protein
MFGERQNQTTRQDCEQNDRKNDLHHLPPIYDRKRQIASDGCCLDNTAATQRLNLSNGKAKRPVPPYFLERTSGASGVFIEG